MHRTHNPLVSAADTDNPAVVSPADILRGAARYLEVHGWTRGTYYAADPGYASGRPSGPFPPACADGAIGMAAYGRITACPGRETSDPAFRDYNRARELFDDYVESTGWESAYLDTWCDGGTDYTCDPADEITFAWNDADGRTAADVIAALRAAADDYDRTHGGTR